MSKTTKTFSDAERAAMQERIRELRSEADGEKDLLAKIALMKGNDSVIAKRLHAIMKANAPSLSPKTWYGMPAYANKNGKVVCFFTAAGKFKARYATFGFNDSATLDDGNIWPTSFAIKKLGPTEEKKIIAIVKKTVK